MSESQLIDPPVPLSLLTQRLSEKDRSLLIDDAARSGELDEPAGKAVVANLIAERPELADVVARLRVAAEPDDLDSEIAPALVLERDATQLALRIAGIDAISTWLPGSNGGYLDRLAYASPEASLIDHDASRFPAWQPVAGTRVDWREFSDGDHRLRIGNVNHTPLERILGVDLIYRHLNDDSFVLVQYKKMSRSVRTGWGYRPDKQLEAELSRMRTIEAVSGGKVQDSTTWRLYPHGCFLKLVRANEKFDPSNDRLLPGIYLPLTYLDEIRANGDAVGDRGGEWLGFDTINRYLTTGLFVALVREGWIGTRGVTTRAVAQLVDAAIGEGHSVIVAEEVGGQPGAERRLQGRRR